MIGVLATSTKILASFMYAFAKNGRQLFIGPVIEFLKETSFISMRSISTKLVKSDELGKVNSLIGIAEGLMPLIYAPMYTQVYRATLDIMPGAFYLLGGLLTLPAVVIFM
jgi:MFS transporter, PCFT/HCP family, solute carrier family 46, member 3